MYTGQSASPTTRSDQEPNNHYLGVNIVAGHKFTCSLDNIARGLSIGHAIFGKVGRIASEDVIIELLKAKCLPAL